METSVTTDEQRERLAHIHDTLNVLSGMAAHDGSKLLRYFVELAVAQARDECVALDKQHIVDGASRTSARLN